MSSQPLSSDSKSRSDESMAGMERAIESGRTIPDGPDESEHFRCYQFVESLTAPLRAALSHPMSMIELPDYETLREIGRGGMGVVYCGIHRQTRRMDAIKVIRPDRLAIHREGQAAELQWRFRREAQLAATVAHEHIVPVYHVGEINGCSWYSMQFVNGKSLRELTHERPMDAETAAILMEQIARAVDKVHRHGILHGDIKPHNILVHADEPRAMITDFGLAHVVDASDTGFGVAGTPAYMAPELALCALQQTSDSAAAVRTSSADIYSLGATLWTILAGHPLINDQVPLHDQLLAVTTGPLPPVPRGIRIPPELLQICRKCTCREPELRYSTAGELADELRQWIHRPRWNRFFPQLRQQLSLIVAPSLLLGGLCVWWLQRNQVSEFILMAVLLSAYPPLFLVLHRLSRTADPQSPARRELWSIWIGHFVATVALLISLRLLARSEDPQWLFVFYPVWAGLSSIASFAKSGNFSTGYRWFGFAWSVLAVILATSGTMSPLIFGIAAAVTCLLITFADETLQSS